MQKKTEPKNPGCGIAALKIKFLKTILNEFTHKINTYTFSIQIS
jgi:hypothetical protein